MLLSVSLILAYSPGFTQQPAGKPVLSADPALPPTAPAPAASVPAGPVAVDPNYVIGPDDSLKINVWNEPKFSDSLPVRPDGMITLPLVGDIRAAGRTPMQLGADITEILKKEITDPSVTVSILMINSKRIYFFGEVVKPGPMPLTPAMTILQAIDTAGGLTAFASKKKIYILRGEPGKQQKILFDYTKAIKTGNMQGIILMAGDTIVVP
jgi:polysaccharide export outer membrane protein